MGLEDRDWYWHRRARKNSPDDDHLFPRSRWPDGKSAFVPVALVVLGIVAVIVFGTHQGWFDRGSRLDAAKQAEIAALRPWEQQSNADVRRPAVPRAHAAPSVPTFHAEHRLLIEYCLFCLMMLSPLALLGLIICVFIRPVRGPALIGLLTGLVGAIVGGKLEIGGLLFQWGLLQPADSMGGAFQFLEVVAASFSLAAITGAVASFVLRKPGSPSHAEATGEAP